MTFDFELEFAHVGAEFATIADDAEHAGDVLAADVARRLRRDIAALQTRFADFGTQIERASKNGRDHVGPILDDIVLRTRVARYALAELRDRTKHANESLRRGVEGAGADLDLAIETAVGSFS